MIRKELIQKRIELFLIIFLFIFLFLVIILTPIINKYRNYGKLIINEVMASNKSTISNMDGKYADYIEIYNGYDYPINLSGYYLSDDNFDTKKWSFPNDTIIKSGEYLVVYASGNDNYLDGELHTNFKINKSGEVITLSDNEAKPLSRVYYLETLSDTSYGYNGEDYVYFYNGTPGEYNKGEYSMEPISKSISNRDIYITEYMVDNVSYKKNKNNSYDAMIELYNDSDEDTNLLGYHLSDTSKKLNKYTFNNIVIPSKSYLTIYMSNKDMIIDNEVYINFNLNEGTLIISDKYNNKLDEVIIKNIQPNISYGLYEENWHYYSKPSFGYENKSDYLNDINNNKEVIINEVSSLNPEAIEIKNISMNNINLSGYAIGDKSGYVMKFPNVTIKANGYITLYGSDKYSYKNNKIYTGFHINNSNEIIYLYKDNVIIDTFYVGKQDSSISTGINSDGNRVYYKNKTFGKENYKTYYLGYSEVPKYSVDGGYIEKGATISLQGEEGSKIYYTLDGTFPTSSSKLYTGEITINKNTVVKAISYKEGYLSSQVVSRTFIVGRKHDLPFISISTKDSNINNLLTKNGNKEIKISFEFYESNGELGVSFIGGTKLTGMDSRKRDQKSMAIYLRKEYGLTEVNYPFFKDSDVTNYSSFTLRNSGEDPYGIRIEDTVFTYALKDQMDIDMQDYRAVVVYINGSYYGLYNMREKLNGDYIETNYGIKDGYDLIKYASANTGSTKNYNNIVNYINSHNVKDKKVYEYIKSQIDVQELCNYLIVESYYGNTDQGNIRYWKSKNGKWRWMLYDLDWSLWNTSLSFNYTVMNTNSPAVTNLYSLYNIGRKLYKNNEFKEMYLSTLAYHMKNTWSPSRMNKIVDELANEIMSEIPYHVKRWSGMTPKSTTSWNNNVKNFKKKLTNRYNYVKKNIKSEFNLSDKEYKKYFGDL